MRGEPVTVLRKEVAYDELRNPTEWWRPEVVENVLVGGGAGGEVGGSIRPDGTSSTRTLAFPKTFSAPLRNCRVEIGGELYRVVGDPHPEQAQNCPTRWWYTVEVEAVNG